MTLVDYNHMLEAQNNLCSLCDTPLNLSGRVAVDHDYKTGLVRAILCIKCNTGLGFFNDDPNMLIKAAKYIQQFRRD